MKTVFSKTLFLILLSMIIFTMVVGLVLLFNVDFKGGLIISQVLPFFLLCISILKIVELLRLKELQIEKEYLIIRYLFFKKVEKIKWDQIEKSRIIIATHGSFNFGINTNFGKRLLLSSSNKKVTVQSFYYKNFEQFFMEIQSHIPVSSKNEMINEFNLKEAKFFKNNSGLFSKVLRFFPLIFLLVWMYLSMKK